MKQFLITYRDRFGAKFAHIVADSKVAAVQQVHERSAHAAILTVREVPATPFITGVA